MIDYEEEWLAPLLFSFAGSVFEKSCCFGIPAASISLGLLFLDDFLPDLRNNWALKDMGSSTLWSAATAGLMLMIGFRLNRAMQRFWEGTGLLHQMRGEWFDTVSNCVSFTLGSRYEKEEEVQKFRHTLVRLMSLCHGNALEEISGNIFELETIDVHGLNTQTLRYLKSCHEEHNFNKVELCIHLIQTLITNALKDNVLQIPPPILSRVYQTLSRGFVNLLNTKKITDTKFPYPCAQLIAFLIFLFTFLTPVMLTTVIHNKVAAAIFSFVPVFVVSAVNYIAMELENPFGKDDNDLPLAHFQQEMDISLLMLLHPHTDTIAGLTSSCDLDFYSLVQRFESRSPTGEPNANIMQSSPSKRRFDSALIRREASTESGISRRSIVMHIGNTIRKIVRSSQDLELPSLSEKKTLCRCISALLVCCRCGSKHGSRERESERRQPSSSSEPKRTSRQSARFSEVEALEVLEALQAELQSVDASSAGRPSVNSCKSSCPELIAGADEDADKAQDERVLMKIHIHDEAKKDAESVPAHAVTNSDVIAIEHALGPCHTTPVPCFHLQMYS